MTATIRPRAQPRFELGQIVTTPGALAACPDEHMTHCLARHLCGDWGRVCSQDALQNEAALSEGWQLFSAYAINPEKPSTGYGQNTLWIITEADRSVTTFLLPEEY